MTQRSLLLTALTLLVGGLLAPGSTLAEEGPDAENMSSEEWEEMMAETYGRKGPYFGVAAVMMLPHEDSLRGPVVIKDDLGAGFNLRFGLRTAPRFAFEVMYEQVSVFETAAFGTSREGKGYFWSLNGKGYFRPNRLLQPYVLAGAGFMSIQPKLTSRRSGFGMRFAAGIDYYLTKKIVANFEGGYALGMGTQVGNYGYGTILVGLGYRF